MSAEGFEQFRKVVLADPRLQHRLAEIEDWAEFTEVVMRESARLQLAVDGDDVQLARQASRRAWLERWI